MKPSLEQPKSGVRFVFVQHGWNRVITAKKNSKKNVVEDGGQCAWAVYYVTPSGQVLMGNEDVQAFCKNISRLNFDPTVSSMNLRPQSDYRAPPSLTHAQAESTRVRLRNQVIDDAFLAYLALHYRSPILYSNFESWCGWFDWDSFQVTDDGRVYLEGLSKSQLEHLAQEFAEQDARIRYEWRCSIRKQDSSRIVRVIQGTESMNPCGDLELSRQESSSSTEIIGSQSSSTILEHESTDELIVSPRTDDQQQLSSGDEQLGDQKTIDQQEAEERPPIDVPAESNRAKRVRQRQEAREHNKLTVGQRARKFKSKRDARARETSEERQERLEKQRREYRKYMATETTEQRARRLESKRVSGARYRERRRLEAMVKRQEGGDALF